MLLFLIPLLNLRAKSIIQTIATDDAKINMILALTPLPSTTSSSILHNLFLSVQATMLSPLRDLSLTTENTFAQHSLVETHHSF